MPAKPVGPLGDLIGDFPLPLFLDFALSLLGGLVSVETTGLEALGASFNSNKGNSPAAAACE
tara:strand:- start:13439 stop:13624 length:186 start_codon:yes stop_codon:yes gene_type:complete